jgi:hypothetical protein
VLQATQYLQPEHHCADKAMQVEREKGSIGAIFVEAGLSVYA